MVLVSSFPSRSIDRPQPQPSSPYSPRGIFHRHPYPSSFASLSFYVTSLFLSLLLFFPVSTYANPSSTPSRLPVRLVHGTPSPTLHNPGIKATPSPHRFPKNITGPDTFRSLAGTCYTLIQNDYEYSLCPFINVTQKQTNNMWNAFFGILGIYDNWNTTITVPSTFGINNEGGSSSLTSPSPTVTVTGSSSSVSSTVTSSSVPVPSTLSSSSSSSSSPSSTVASVTNIDSTLRDSFSTHHQQTIFTTQYYNDGTECASGKRRRTTVSFICSGEGGGTVLKEVHEPLTCEYTMVLACPQACTADYRVGYEADPLLPALTPTPSPTPTVSVSSSPSSTVTVTLSVSSTPSATTTTTTVSVTPSPSPSTVTVSSSASVSSSSSPTQDGPSDTSILLSMQKQLTEMQSAIQELKGTINTLHTLCTEPKKPS